MRQSKIVNGVTTQHIYNGMNVVQEKESGNLKATYHRAGNQIIYFEVNGNKNFYIYNAQGNVSKLLNTDYETVADYTFDAFGVQRAVNGDVYNPFRHNGEYYDDELGYTYLRNRYYDNASGRFITEDPIKDGTNWYSYCGNNPICYKDSLGLWEDGDENLSPGAQTYIKYYTEKWKEANQAYQNAQTQGEKDKAQKAMDFYHAAACDIRDLDSQGRVEGKTLDVPIYNQLDTEGGDKLCWSTCMAMWISYYEGVEQDLTKDIAIAVAGSEAVSEYSKPGKWISTDSIPVISEKYEITSSQCKTTPEMEFDDIYSTINNECIFGINYTKPTVNGHYVLGVGYATASGHEPLIVTNDPYGGIQRTQSYNEVLTYEGDRTWTISIQGNMRRK